MTDKEECSQEAGSGREAPRTSDALPIKEKYSTLNNIDDVLPSYKATAWVFVCIVVAALLVPLVGMLWAPSDSTSENRELAEAPSLWSEEGAPNVGVLADAGNYFTDHFAYRSLLVDADARLYSSLFGVSTVDNVIVGDDEWLYYAGTLADYQDRSPLRDRQIANIAHNLRMLQDWCEAQGSTFAFTIAPDKNHLYGEAMPAWYPEVESADMERLKERLEAEGVNYVDMFAVFDGAITGDAAGAGAGVDGTEDGAGARTPDTNLPAVNETQYFLRDSHWSDRGALIAHDAIADSIGFETGGIAPSDLEERIDYIGDLNRMLYPVSAIPEADWYAQGVNDGSGASGTQRSGSYWTYVEGADPNDGIVVTEPSPTDVYASTAEKNGSMLMFRDSFAIGLLPYFACETDHARFDKMVPYDGLQLLDASYDAVVVERAQRHVSDLVAEPFIMPCPIVDAPAVIEPIDAEPAANEAAHPESTSTNPAHPEDDAAPPSQATCNVETTGSLVLVSGEVENLGTHPDDIVYIEMTDSQGTCRVYEAFGCSGNDGNDDGYAAYVSADAWAGKTVKIRVLEGSAEQANCVGSFDVTIEG